MSSNIGVMGHPIGHTKSPVFQQAGLDELGIKETFEAWDVAPDDLEAIYAEVDDELAAKATDEFVADPGTIVDHKWTGAEVKACCRLSALLDVPLLQAAQNVGVVPPDQQTGQK